MRTLPALLIVLLAARTLSPTPALASQPAESLLVRLSPAVSNSEIANQEFATFTPPAMRSAPTVREGELRFGQIKRRLPGDPSWYSLHHIPFAAAYREGLPLTLWCDVNLNGRLDDEEPVHLFDYPSPQGARAGLVDFAWTAVSGGDSIPVAWKFRIVLEPLAPPDTLPRYRLQQIYANTGTVRVDGQDRRAFLFDGSYDGLYNREYGDGLFIDANGDGQVTVDPSDPEFLPFSVSAQVGRTLFEATRIDPLGRSLVLAAASGQDEQRRAEVGEPAPDFSFVALDRKHIRLSEYRGHPVVVYFWASWCGACEQLAPQIRSVYDRLHPQGLQMIGVSFDDNRTKLLEFELRHREPWPISFVGKPFFENPIGRLYGVATTGAAYLVDAEGRFQGRYFDFEALESRVRELLAQSP